MSLKLNQEISEDYDIDNEETDKFFDNLDKNHSEIEAMSSTIQQLMDSSSALEQFGIDRTSVMILRATDLLAGTSFDAIAMESMNVHTNHKEATVLAIESLDEKASDTTTKWSTRILTSIKETSGKVLAILSPIFTKISSAARTISHKVWDVTKAAGRTIKAHPFKTILVVLAAITAAAGIVVYFGGNLPLPNSTKESVEVFRNKITSMASNIKWPFVRSAPTISPVTPSSSGWTSQILVNGKWVDSGEAIAGLKAGPSNTASNLGWTKSTIETVRVHTDQVWSKLKGGLGALSNRGFKYTRQAWGHLEHGVNQTIPNTVLKATGSHEAAHTAKLAGWGALGFMVYININRIIWAMYRLVKFVIVGGLRLIGNTLKAIFNLFVPSTAD
jgi:ElaB/YqjD/DUF883 family membrane-anchored ribosome-binding protein